MRFAILVDMKLSYKTPSLTIDTRQQVLILKNSRNWRIEMQLRRNEDQSYTLVAMSGIGSKPAELSKLQGPYQTKQQASAARSAIAVQLLEKNFEVLNNEHSIWSLQAQKAIQKVRLQRQQSQGDFDFHPDDVL